MLPPAKPRSLLVYFTATISLVAACDAGRIGRKQSDLIESARESGRDGVGAEPLTRAGPAEASPKAQAEGHTDASVNLAANHARMPTNDDATTRVDPVGPQAGLEDERNSIAVFRAVAPAVVHVTQNQTIRPLWSPAQTVEAGTGTGFIWDQDGHIVTNAHVVSDSQKGGVSRTASFEIATYDGSRYPATLVGVAPEKDLAVLRIETGKKNLVPVRLVSGDESLEVGQKTLAIGNPYGLDHTLTTGIISALEREVEGFGGVTIRNMIQTDASINPGNSGGPLLNSAGEVIGINTMIYSRSGASAGIGFAVPAQTIRRLVPQLIKYGKVRRVGFGIDIMPDSVARQLGVRGVIIRDFRPGSPAAKAGLLPAKINKRTGELFLDVIVGVDNEKIASYDDLYAVLDGHEAGDVVKLRIRRGEKTLEIPMTLMVINASMN
jgi:S1-C subfamily serine protease